MARTKFKCQFVICVYLIIAGSVRSLPIPLSSLETKDSVYSNVLREVTFETVNAYENKSEMKTDAKLPVNRTIPLLERSSLRPGQSASRYSIQITRDGDTFNGRAVIDIQLTDASRSNAMFFNMVDLEVSRVQLGVLTEQGAIDANFSYQEEQQSLRISPLPGEPTSYVAIIEYRGNIRTDGIGLYRGQYGDADYIGMNLHSTYARRVFPCLDEPNLSAMTTFTFVGFDHEHILSNSLPEENQTEGMIMFRPLEAPNYLWGMVSHNLQIATQLAQSRVLLYVRPDIQNLFNLASVILTNFYTTLNEWTNQPHSEIVQNQDPTLHVMAVPDISRDSYALSTVSIWEPYILTEENGSITQKKLIFVKTAEALARQWFGYIIRIENWRYQWITSALTSYAAYEVVKNFQTDDDPLSIDMDSVFTTDVIQESLLHDSYNNAQPIQLSVNIYAEVDIRQHINGILKYKAPAILRMARLSLGPAEDETDFIQVAARTLLNTRAFVPITSQGFYDAVQSAGVNQNNFISSWVTTPGYPILSVSLGNGVINLRQRRFGYSSVPQRVYNIPITFTTGSEPQFDNLHATTIMDNPTSTINSDIGEEWVIMNLQGQGYYRVNYSPDLWERIILALEDPEQRQEIHSLNRASLIDDSFNLARAGELDYDIALRIALTMENELDYAVWRAFVRNIEFLKKRLIPFASSSDDLDDTIFLRLITRIITLVEEEYGFGPYNPLDPPMNILTRGLVMDFACRSGYEPCIAAAVDLFYDPNDLEAMNTNIPHELRPAVYCTMVMEGDESVRQALIDHMSNENSKYERLVILQSLACSQDFSFINEYLLDTIEANNNQYDLAERIKIFEAVASSSADNARLALNFLRGNTDAIRTMYGGPEKLEEVLYIMAENLITEDLYNEYAILTDSVSVVDSLSDSRDLALRFLQNANENMQWNNNHLQEVYDWIDLNHAPTIFVSSLLMTLSLLITFFNN
ncbi:membrane alanyl aminopeptidase-like [Melitaea cinxia]|uniref:membrane alanyl aminopeptidase-like n=1 Tax=Melitaea cinxia TaxID=113334 RepID=UPI001E26EC44|nr:membrane alanyl aminopeptidase-like [Melitaea cinxia]